MVGNAGDDYFRILTCCPAFIRALFLCGFVACWGGEVAALVLGWCTGGSLDGVLKEPDLE